MADEVRQEISRGDTESALSLLHGLKGVAGNLSATMLYATTIELETRIRQGEISELGSLLDKFEGILGQTIGCARNLQTAMERVPPASENPSDSPERSPHLGSGSAVPSDQSIEACTGTVEGLPATNVLHEPDAVEEEPVEKYRADLASLLMELDGFLRNNDLDARDCVSSVREQIVLPELLDEVQLLWEQIVDLEFDKARGTLTIIAMELGITLEQGQ